MSLSKVLALNVPPGSAPPPATNQIILYDQLSATGLTFPLGLFNSLNISNIGTHLFLITLSTTLTSVSQGITFILKAQEDLHIDAPGYDTLTLWDAQMGSSSAPIPLPSNLVFGTTAPANGSGFIVITSSPVPFTALFGGGVPPWTVLAEGITATLVTGTHVDYIVDTNGATDVLLLYGVSGNGGTLTPSAYTTNNTNDNSLVPLWTGAAITGIGNFSQVLGQDNPSFPLGNNLTFRLTQTGAGNALQVVATILAR